MYKLYFTPYLFNENNEWKSILDKGKEYQISWQHSVALRDFDLVYVKRGYVRYYCNTNIKNDNFTLIVGPSSLVNVGGVMTGANRFSHISTDTSADIVIFDSYYLWDTSVVEEHPEIYISMSNTLTKTVQLFSRRAQLVLFYACFPRFCNILLRFMERAEIKGIPHVKGMTQNDLAQLSGMHPVTLSKVMKKLREMGVIGKLTSTYLEILDVSRLTALGTLSTDVNTCSPQVSHNSY